MPFVLTHYLCEDMAHPMSCATIILVYGEVIEYLKGLPNFADKYAKLQRVLDEIPAYPLTYAIVERYADIRRTLRPLGKDSGDIDTLIAATAPDLKMKLVNLKSA